MLESGKNLKTYKKINKEETRSNRKHKILINISREEKIIKFSTILKLKLLMRKTISYQPNFEDNKFSFLTMLKSAEMNKTFCFFVEVNLNFPKHSKWQGIDITREILELIWCLVKLLSFTALSLANTLLHLPWRRECQPNEIVFKSMAHLGLLLYLHPRIQGK